MFRFMRPLKTILSVSRLPLKVESQAARGEVYKVQNVRFQKQRFRPRAFAVTVLTGSIGYWAFSKLVLGPLGEALVEADPDPEPKDIGKDEAPLFIPFPGTTKVLQHRKYVATDPESQAFNKIYHSEREVRHVKEELANLLIKFVRVNPILAGRHGRGDIKVSGYWLTLTLTDRPPLMIRYGIEIADDYIAWAYAPVDPETVSRTRRVLFPTSMAISLWSLVKVIFTDDARKVARMLGLQIGGNPPTIEELLSKQQPMAKLLPPTKDRPTTKQPQLLGDSQTQKSTVLTAENSNLANKPSTQEEVNEYQWKTLVSAMAGHFSQRVSQGVLEFKRKLRQTWTQQSKYPKAGSIKVNGLVELESEKSWTIFNVTAHWDPKTNSYDPRDIVIGLIRMQSKSISPKGRSSNTDKR